MCCSPIGCLHLVPLSCHARSPSLNISPKNLFFPSFQLCFYHSLFIFFSCHCSRAAVPGGTPPVQAATGSSGWVLLGELPVRPPQSRLGSCRGGAPTWWRSHRRGYREAAVPNGGYVMTTGPVSRGKPGISIKTWRFMSPDGVKGIWPVMRSDTECVTATRMEMQGKRKTPGRAY